MNNINKEYLKNLSIDDIQTLVDDYFHMNSYPEDHLYRKVASALFNKKDEDIIDSYYLLIMPYLTQELLKRINNNPYAD